MRILLAGLILIALAVSARADNGMIMGGMGGGGGAAVAQFLLVTNGSKMCIDNACANFILLH